MKDIYITRHGQTEWNVEGRLQGSGNSELTARGIEDAEKLAVRLKDIPFDRVYTSDLLRAVQTADILMGERDIPRTVLPEIRELKMGSWEGKLISELETLDPEAFERWEKGSCEFAAPGGESVQDLYVRAKTALDIITADDCDTVLIVTHGMFQSALLEVLRGHDFGGDMTIHVGTALSHFTMGEDGHEEKLTGCTRHLEDH